MTARNSIFWNCRNIDDKVSVCEARARESIYLLSPHIANFSSEACLNEPGALYATAKDGLVSQCQRSHKSDTVTTTESGCGLLMYTGEQ